MPLSGKITFHEITTLVCTAILLWISVPVIWSEITDILLIPFKILLFLNSEQIDDKWFTLITGFLAVFAAWWTIKHQNQNFLKIYKFEINRNSYEYAERAIRQNKIIIKNLDNLLLELKVHHDIITDNFDNSDKGAVKARIENLIEIVKVYKDWEGEINENPNIKYDLGHINRYCATILSLPHSSGFTDDYFDLYSYYEGNIKERISFIKKELARENRQSNDIINRFKIIN